MEGNSKDSDDREEGKSEDSSFVEESKSEAIYLKSRFYGNEFPEENSLVIVSSLLVSYRFRPK